MHQRLGDQQLAFFITHETIEIIAIPEKKARATKIEKRNSDIKPRNQNAIMDVGSMRDSSINYMY